MKKLKSVVEVDEFTKYASKAFDYNFTGESFFEPHEKPTFNPFLIGLIVGASGSGKSTLLKEYGEEEKINWCENKAIVSHFNTPEEAIDKLSAAGLNSIPSLMKPYHVLSTGEKFRANLARKIKDNATIDEFTSVVNRDVAKAASVSISKYIRRNNIKNVVFASCHKDIVEWLCPDWVYDCDTKTFNNVRLLRPAIRIDIYRCKNRLWEMFKNHHYLSAEMNKAATCYVGVYNGIEIAFNCSLPLPGKIPPLYEGDSRNKYRESRTVILPDFQGLGAGVRFSDAIADIYLNMGYRYFSKTAHIRMGEYRNKADWWRQTSTNLKSREKSQKRSKKELWHHMLLDTKRLCYSHEYIGKNGDKHREKYEEKLKGISNAAK